MKHNEFKAFFKKKLVDTFCSDYEIISIDETMSSRNIYVIEKDTLITRYLIKCWFATNDYSISIFSIDESVNKEINFYKDYLVRFSANYNCSSYMKRAIDFLYSRLNKGDKLCKKGKSN